MAAMKPKLFHTLVVMGAALTGGAVLTTACGGGSTCQNPLPTGDCYPHISYNPDALPHIANDAYAHIGYNPDGYPNISIDTGSKEAGDANDGAPGDAAEGG